MADDPAVLVVVRPPGRWREHRGRPDIWVDGRVRGQLGSGERVEVGVRPGEHRVQIGRQVMTGLSRQLFVGSPILTVTVSPGAETRVRVEPSGVPAAQQTVLAESSFRLVEERADDRPNATTPPVAERVPVGWILNPYTRALIDKPRPWKSWQAVATLVLVVYAGWFLIAVTVLGRHPRPAAWVWGVMMCVGTLATLISWASLYRARRHASNRAR